jgi:hypothetical protein
MRPLIESVPSILLIYAQALLVSLVGLTFETSGATPVEQKRAPIPTALQYILKHAFQTHGMSNHYHSLPHQFWCQQATVCPFDVCVSITDVVCFWSTLRYYKRFTLRELHSIQFGNI